jgi:hypothetical protein
MGASPTWPGNNTSRLDASLRQALSDAADFLNRPAGFCCQRGFWRRLIGLVSDRRQHAIWLTVFWYK